MTTPTPTPAPNPLESLSVATLLSDVQKGLADLSTALAFVDKFSSFLPTQYQEPLQLLQTVLTTVEAFLTKLAPAS